MKNTEHTNLNIKLFVYSQVSQNDEREIDISEIEPTDQSQEFNPPLSTTTPITPGEVKQAWLDDAKRRNITIFLSFHIGFFIIWILGTFFQQRKYKFIILNVDVNSYIILYILVSINWCIW